MSLSRVIVSISEIDVICEVRDFESPFVHYRLEPIGAAGEVVAPATTFNQRN
jgi:hypothetical protein